MCVHFAPLRLTSFCSMMPARAPGLKPTDCGTFHPQRLAETALIRKLFYRDNGEENGNYYSILGLYRYYGKENGNYYSGF